MLIPTDQIMQKLIQHEIKIHGVFHIGAHTCEEMPFYIDKLRLKDTDVVWIDAIEDKVKEAKAKKIPNVFHATITDKDGDIVKFNISNNIQSSSVLELGIHTVYYPNIVYSSHIYQKTTTVDTFFRTNGLNPKKYNFWNFDIQGAEMMALKGATDSLPHIDVIYLEVNTKEVYVNCSTMNEIDDFLSKYGFVRVLTCMTAACWGDALYLRPKKLEFSIKYAY